MAFISSAFTTNPLSPRNATLIGVGLMSVGVFAYSINDAMGKWLVSVYAAPQVMFIRSLFAFAALTPFLWRERRMALQTMERPVLQLLRALAAVFDVACFYVAAASLPLANVMTYYLAGPIYVTALSPFLLGERVGWRRWAAVIIGFAGVVIALDPGSPSLGLAELTAFGGSLSFTVLIVTTRKLRGASETVLIATQVTALLLAGLLVTPFVWITPSPRDFLLLGLLGVVSMAAGFCVNRALKLAPASVVAPYQYAFIVWAVIFGYAFFGDVPQPRMLIGAAIIIVAGMYIFVREQSLARSGRRLSAPAANGARTNL